MSHLLSTVLLLLLFLRQLPYTMREMTPNGFLLSIGSAAVMPYIKPERYGCTELLWYMIQPAL